MANYYQILGVAQDAPFAVIKVAYKRQALLLHPDRNNTPGATAAFQMLGNAWDTLRDQRTRKDYDKKLQGQNQGRHCQAPRPHPSPPFSPTNSRRNHFSYYEYNEHFFHRFRSPRAGPKMRLRTDTDIIEAQVELLAMRSEYRRELQRMAMMIESRYRLLKIYKTHEEVMQAAKIQPGMAQRLHEMVSFGEAINSRFAERVAECMEDMRT